MAQTIYIPVETLEIGQTFTSDSLLITKDKIIAFAKEFDPQPFHLDEDEAKQTFFNELVASGWHTSSVTMKLILQSMPFKHGMVGSGGQVSWKRPVKPNDSLHVTTKIINIKPAKNNANQIYLTLECQTLNQFNRVCQIMEANVIAFN